MWIHSISLQGRRNYNEDEYTIINNIKDKDITLHNIGYFGIYDGHGGGEISKFCKKNIHKYFLEISIINKIPTTAKEYNKYIIKTFENIQKILELKKKEAKFSGSTVLITMIYDKFCKVINLGDCRAIYCNDYNIAIQMSKDHKPTTYDEFKRIKNEKGKITKEKNDDYRINGMSVSKSLGDLDAKPQVSHIPDIYDYNIDKTKFIIMACDGFWDVLSNQEVIDYVLSILDNNNYKKNRSSKDDKNIANKLANLAYNKGSEDNITVIIIFF